MNNSTWIYFVQDDDMYQKIFNILGKIHVCHVGLEEEKNDRFTQIHEELIKRDKLQQCEILKMFRVFV